jgi:hypothetical protein
MALYVPAEKYKKWYIIAFIFIGFCGLILAIPQYLEQKRTDEATENFQKQLKMAGTLNSKGIPASADQNPEMISLGGMRMFVDPGTFGSFSNDVLLTDRGDPVLWTTEFGGRFSVSCDIRNEDGDLIAQVRDNEWQLNKDLIFDRNFSDKALEVKEKNGNVVLQVAHLGQILYIAGVFRSKSGYTTTIANISTVNPHVAPGEGIKGLQAGNSIWQVSLPHEYPQVTINPIFDYSSELHFGSCPGYEKLKESEPPITNSGPIYVFSKPLDIGH